MCNRCRAGACVEDTWPSAHNWYKGLRPILAPSRLKQLAESVAASHKGSRVMARQATTARTHLPESSRAMLLHLFPKVACSSTMRWSSSGVKAPVTRSPRSWLTHLSIWVPMQ